MYCPFGHKLTVYTEVKRTDYAVSHTVGSILRVDPDDVYQVSVDPLARCAQGHEVSMAEATVKGFD